MALSLVTPAAVLPLSRDEVKEHLRLDRVDQDVTAQQLFPPLARAAGTYTGATVDAAANRATFVINGGVRASGNTNLGALLQESADGVVWTNWTAAEFDPITTDNQFRELDYTGQEPYVRLRMIVTGSATIECSASVSLQARTSQDNAWLDRELAAATADAETIIARSLCTATWKLTLDRFPPPGRYDWSSRAIRLPRAPVVAIASLRYRDTSGAWQTLTSGTDYELIAGEPARVITGFGTTWPATALMPGSVEVTFTAGYGAAAAVPALAKTYLLARLAFVYANREAALPDTLANLLAPLCWGAGAALNPGCEGEADLCREGAAW